MSKTRDEPSKEFSDEIFRALSVFQLIEENLKLYIKYSFQLIRVKLDKTVPFKFDGDDYKNSSLERLIIIFSKVSNDSNLVKKLNKVKEKRNYCAHLAIIEYMKENENNSEHHQLNMAKIKDMSIEAWTCAGELQAELDKLNTRIMGL